MHSENVIKKFRFKYKLFCSRWGEIRTSHPLNNLMYKIRNCEFFLFKFRNFNDFFLKKI